MSPFTIFLVSFFILHHRVTSDLTQETQALQTFISKLPHDHRYSWNSSEFVCNWRGITCDPTNSSVIYLRLPGAGLVGEIPPNTIGTLSQLRVLSLRSNGLTGSIPSDFSNLSSLQSVYLQSNNFSGRFPAILAEMTGVEYLDLSDNKFSGEIPFSVNNSTKLTNLLLQNNELTGEIPPSLSKFPVSAFSGNINLCGNPLPPCNKIKFLTPSPSRALIKPRKKSKKLSTGAISGIALGSSALILALLLPFFLLCSRKTTTQQTDQPPKPPLQSSAADARTSSSQQDIAGAAMTGRNKLVFIESGIYSFSLDDLWRAEAEVLGKGSTGTSYKAMLEYGTTVVVKRLRDVAATEKQFELQMEVLGKMKDEHLLKLRAYYYSKDEKLLVYDFMPAGCLFTVLHGSKASCRTQLDWDHRMRIALCAAKGVAYLHVVGKLVHGNIKSSNILLHQDTNKVAYVSDFGLKTLSGGSNTPNNQVTGYQAPEVLETQKATFKSDVYSFGVVLLELLTGKAPNQASVGEEGIDLPQWVQSVVKEEWIVEVIDLELLRYQNVEGDLVQILQLAMDCVSTMPYKRPTMQEVVMRIENLNRAEMDDGIRRSSNDPSKGSNTHTTPTETRNWQTDVTL